MKKLLFPAGTLLCLSVLLCCSKKDNPSAPGTIDTANLVPDVTDRGVPDGISKAVSIGAPGGSLTSDDGQLTVSIPAGALSQTTVVSIQPITNTAPQGLGKSYRLTPEGTTFAKPVSLTFHYDDNDLGGNDAQLLWITTQKADGSWNALLKSEVNTTSKTVTVQATHFSDWSLGTMMQLQLSPASRSVKTGQSVELSVWGFYKYPKGADEALMPLASVKKVPFKDANTILATTATLQLLRVDNWRLNGSAAPVSNTNGALKANDNTATYMAPAKKPTPNKVAVSASIEAQTGQAQKITLLLVSNITIIDTDYYLHLTVDDKDYDYTQWGLNGQSPPDPDNLQMINAALNDDGAFSIAGAYTADGTTYFMFTSRFEKPQVGARQFSCFQAEPSSQDEIDFTPSAQVPTTYTNTNYVRQKIDGACDEKPQCAAMQINITEHSNDNRPIIGGTFTGSIYEDQPDFEKNCKSAVKHTIAGEFRVVAL